MKEPKAVEIGKRIRQRRENLGMTQEDLAVELGLNKSTVQRYESGEIKRIKLPILETISECLNVNPEWLVLKTDDPTDYKSLIDEVPDYLVDHFGDAEKAAKIWTKMERENQEVAAKEKEVASFNSNIYQNNGENYGIIGNNNTPVENVNCSERSLTDNEKEILHLFSELTYTEQAKVIVYAAELKEKRDKAL